MPDLFLYAGEPNPSDIKLSDPTLARGASSNTTGTAAVTGVSATAASVALLIFTGSIVNSTGHATSAASASQIFTSVSAGTASASLSAANALLLFSATALDIALAATSAGTGSGATAGDTTGTAEAIAQPATAFATGLELEEVSAPINGVFSRGRKIVSGTAAMVAATGRSTAQGQGRRYHNSITADATGLRAVGAAAGLVDYEAQNEEEILLCL